MFITKVRKFLTRIGLCKYQDISTDDRDFAYSAYRSPRGKSLRASRDYF